MSNLGDYQRITTLAKKLGGPKRLAVAVGVGGYAVIRFGEGATRKAIRTLRERGEPCPLNGLVFVATSAGNDDGAGVTLDIGDRYRVLEGDGEVVLIEVLGDGGSPYFVSADFLRSVSDFPPGDAST
jgi:hypothetical protein